MHSSRRMPTFTSPTCEDLGLPRDAIEYESHGEENCGEVYSGKRGYLLPNCEPHDPVTINGLKYEPENPNNPFSPYCRIPLPNPYGCYEYGMEPAFIRKRNERERERVRCVNDGYARLREHLPVDQKPEKRISKVETLRSAIRYIKQLQSLLSKVDQKSSDSTMSSSREPLVAKKRKRTGENGDELDSSSNPESKKKRFGSLYDDDKSRRS